MYIDLTPEQKTLRQTLRSYFEEIMTPEEIERILQKPEKFKFETGLTISPGEFEGYAYGDGEAGVYMTNPGPHPKESLGFLPFGIAISFFFMWAISGAGQPSSMVRLMAFNSSQTLRRSIFTVAMYLLPQASLRMWYCSA